VVGIQVHCQTTCTSASEYDVIDVGKPLVREQMVDHCIQIGLRQFEANTVTRQSKRRLLFPPPSTENAPRLKLRTVVTCKVLVSVESGRVVAVVAVIVIDVAVDACIALVRSQFTPQRGFHATNWFTHT
jgi:hypothetical protein